ncbi:hypothetical protein OSB04_029706 [Centaurea solstitialis]|uniref:Uncharacterized protein n=1 Tax=Centaurea solstitialis TaxID=347529 RepID=A0AA38SDR8_9ASTR|nr:hypothetical protein OSB04_029706 [Centaurea solstitialis]
MADDENNSKPKTNDQTSDHNTPYYRILSIPKCSCASHGCNINKKLGELRDKERPYEFLHGLDNEFSTIRTRILAMKPIPTLGEAYHLVTEDEQRAMSIGKKTNTVTVAFQACLGV